MTVKANLARPDADREAERILIKSRDAYASLASYEGSVEVSSRTDWPTVVLRYEQRALISFHREGRIRIQGWDSNGEPYVILSDGVDVFSRGISSKEYEKHPTIADALITWTGVSRSVTTTLPAILLGVRWTRQLPWLPNGNDLLTALATSSSLRSQEKIGDHLCYCVVCEREIGTWTLWIDSEKFLIRRYRESLSLDQLKARGGRGRSGTILSMETTHEFIIDGVNRDIDDALFDLRSEESRFAKLGRRAGIKRFDQRQPIP